MEGAPVKADCDVVVVGGGLAGLACAHALARARVEVRLLEGSPRLGGVVATRRGEHLFEEGPNTVQAGGAHFRALVDELGLSERLVCTRDHEGRPSAGGERHLWHAGRLVALPAKPSGLLGTPLLSWRAKAMIATEPLRRFHPPGPGEEEPTFEAFLSARIGREATMRLAGAFVRGVHGAEIGALGARSAFPRLWEATCRHGSLLKAARALQAGPATRLPGPDWPRGALVSFPSGLQELVEALARELGAHASVSSLVDTVERAGRLWRVRTSGGATLHARAVVLATPAPMLARLCGRWFDRSWCARAAAIPHASLVVAHLAFAPGAVPADAPRGFGFLVPPEAASRPDAPLAWGAIHASELFEGRAPRGARSYAVFLPPSAVEGLDDDEVARVAAADLARASGMRATPRLSDWNVRRWHNAIPTFGVGHMRLVADIRAALAAQADGLEVAASWTDGISVDSVVGAGREAARRVQARLLSWEDAA
ncbi:MAG: protoporphyrinogen oxidase [Planctomycetia bacterium]